MFPRRRGRVVSLLAFCVLAWTATASADCAWVLWSLGTVDPPTWQPVASFRAEGSCVQVRQVMARESYPLLRDAPDSPETYATLRCLPDTIDPRGPKRR
jgi:hypothetical protein